MEQCRSTRACTSIEGESKMFAVQFVPETIKGNIGGLPVELQVTGFKQNL